MEPVLYDRCNFWEPVAMILVFYALTNYTRRLVNIQVGDFQHFGASIFPNSEVMEIILCFSLSFRIKIIMSIINNSLHIS